MVVLAQSAGLLVGAWTPVTYEEELIQPQVQSIVVWPKVSATPIVVVVPLVPTLPVMA